MPADSTEERIAALERTVAGLVAQHTQDTSRLEARIEALTTRLGAEGAPDPDAGHEMDAELAFDAGGGGMWESLGAGDWELKEEARPAYDAWVRAQVGVGRYGADHSPAPGSAFLLLKHVNTAKQANDTPTWGRAYTAAELVRIAHTAGVDNGTALIRRGGGGGADAGASDANYVESHWVIEGGQIVGVHAICKVTQHEALFTNTVRFVTHENGNFEKGAVESVEADSDDRIVASSIALAAVHAEKWSAMLRPDTREGPDTIERGALTPAPAPIKTDHAAEVVGGEPKFVVTIEDGAGAKATLGSNPAGGGDGAGPGDLLLQKVTSPKMTLSNPTEGKIAIAKIEMEWKQADGAWKPFGGGTKLADSWGGSGSATNPFEISTHSSHDTKVVGAELVTADGTRILDPDGDPLARRLHSSFAQGAAEPLVCRVLVTDDQGATVSICFEHANAPVEEHARDYEAALAMGADGTGIGADFKCLAWLSAEDPLTLKHFGALMTVKKEDATKWFFRAERFRTTVPVNTDELKPSAIARQAYLAALRGETEHEVRASEGCSVTMLIDPEVRAAYALRFGVRVLVPGTEEVSYEGSTSMLMPWDTLSVDPKPYKEQPAWSW